MTTRLGAPATRPASISGTVAAWLLYGLQLCGEAVLGLLSLLSLAIRNTSCASTGLQSRPASCTMSHFGSMLFGYWTVLAIATVGVPVAIVIATRHGRRAWPWSIGGLCALALMGLLLARLLLR